MSSASKLAGTLYSLPEYYRTLPCLISAAYSNTQISLSDTVPATIEKHIDTIYKQLYPEIPVFVSADAQTVLHDSNSIAYFLSNDQLRASNSGLQYQCQVLEWTYFAERELVPLVESCAYIKPHECKTGNNTDKCTSKDEDHKLKQTTLTKSKEEVKKVLNHLNDYLKSNTFFTNERITLADIAVFSNCFLLFKLSSMKDKVNPLNHLLRWFNTILHQPEVIKALGDLATKFEFFKVDTLSTVVTDDKKETKHEQKSENDVSSHSHGANSNTEAENADTVPKSKNPLAALPKGSFGVDDFKRVYSNQDTEKVAIPYFWEHFDPEHYSIWFCSYKFPEELKLTFMTSNLISGMFQRLDTMRNHAFASMCIFGEDNNNTIAGIWLWRGQKLAFELCSDWGIDYESYTWNKLDISKPEVKELINEYLLWTPKNYQDKAFNDGKIFK
ncbi:hypothetical protein GJ496_006058 [Pomphorhynchus laevis]|nr:hypothetical protein GJ496_006058 [Pomphorhynchus laevis]